MANNPILSTDPSGLEPGIGLTWPTPFKAPGTCGGGSSFVNWKILDQRQTVGLSNMSPLPSKRSMRRQGPSPLRHQLLGGMEND